MRTKKSDFIVIGLGFGDEGKGAITDYLVDRFGIGTVIRFNGGSQAAHNVITPDGISHTFSQFGSGTLIKEARTFLSRQMLVDPYSLLEEEFVLKQKGILDAMKLLTIDPNCVIITPFHKMVGQMEEVSRGKRRFGSTGKGVGEAVLSFTNDKEGTLILKDFFSKKILSKKLEIHYLNQFKKAFSILAKTKSPLASKICLYFKNKYNLNQLFNFYEGFAKSYSKSIDSKGNHLQTLLKSKSSLLLEGAQGVLLDPEFGFFPYITKTKTTLGYAQNLLKSKRKPTCIGVLRAYSHRHGAGPLPTESILLSKKIKEEHNLDNPWQGEFRIGWLDLVLCRYAIKINPGIDSIALTCLDQLSGLSKIKVCIEYRYNKNFPESMKRFFQYKKTGNEIRIIGINPILNSSEVEKKQIAQVLLNSKPSKYLEFKGWKEYITKLNLEKEFPKNLKVYLDFLESKEGFGLPISILSFGKTRREKFFRGLEPN